jgi:hypothetical protein
MNLSTASTVLSERHTAYSLRCQRLSMATALGVCMVRLILRNACKRAGIGRPASLEVGRPFRPSTTGADGTTLSSLRSEALVWAFGGQMDGERLNRKERREHKGRLEGFRVTWSRHIAAVRWW